MTLSLPDDFRDLLVSLADAGDALVKNKLASGRTDVTPRCWTDHASPRARNTAITRSASSSAETPPPLSRCSSGAPGTSYGAFTR